MHIDINQENTRSSSPQKPQEEPYTNLSLLPKSEPWAALFGTASSSGFPVIPKKSFCRSHVSTPQWTPESLGHNGPLPLVLGNARNRCHLDVPTWVLQIHPSCTKILSLNNLKAINLNIFWSQRFFFLCLCPHAKPTSTTLKSKVWGRCRLKRKTISFGGTSTLHLLKRIWATSWHHADDVKPSFHHESQWAYTLQNLLRWAKMWECPCGCSWKVPGKQRIHIS